jgi:predicted RecA/RadA family phage recombinase
MNPILASITAGHALAIIVGLIAIAVVVFGGAPAMAAGAVFVNNGKRILYSNTGSAIVAHDVIAIASGTTGRIGIALVDIAATTGTGIVEIAGRHTLPKASGEAFTQLQLLYWDGTQLSGTSTTTSTRAGRAAVAAASADTTADCLINEF